MIRYAVMNLCHTWSGFKASVDMEELVEGRSDEIFDYPSWWAPEMMVVCDLPEGKHNTQLRSTGS